MLSPDQVKVCTKCGEAKPFSEYAYDKKGRNKLRAICKACKSAYFTAHRKKNKAKFSEYTKKWYAKPENTVKVRGYWLARKFKVSLADYDKMFAKQKGACAICGTSESGGMGPHFSIDHCHTTGKVRGLLCRSCNVGIGNFKDDVSLMETAIKYIKAHK